MAKGKEPTKRHTVTFSVATIEYVEALVKVGTHGSDVPDVLRSLVEDGVRRAIRDGLISPRKPA